jgi:PIN domain nuclease of toxin-antitoxin system
LNLLLDTHTLLWIGTHDPRLSRAASEAVSDNRNAIYVSAVTAYEIALKVTLRKLEFIPARPSVVQALTDYKFLPLPISVRHAEHAGTLGLHHRDPFDRLLAAQALVEEMPIVSSDLAFLSFGVKTVW